LDTNVLNGIVVGALAFLALASAGLLWAALSVVTQANRTLTAFERLADTLDTELGPTLQEVQKVVIGVAELKTIAAHKVTDVSTKVEDVTENLSKAAGDAKKNSSVLGAGFLAGVRAYFEGKDAKKHARDQDKDYKSNTEPKRIST